ncbi:MAG TPA: FAD-dependent monooxygenase [Jatrophihabitans sp.]|nr:FAD-dependent monooxygenase [Jatrophihabitans sp.]
MDTQVIVVGAGPVGSMLAGELRLGGAEVIVLERLAVPTKESRASTLHARTMELFDQRGLLARLGSPASQRMGHFGGIPLDLGELATRYPGQWKVLQADVEKLLAEWAVEHGADLRRAHEVVGLRAGPDRVRVRVDGPGGPRELTAEYLVGCDGEQSTVRQLAGIELVGLEATRELFRADVAGIEIAERRFQRLPNGLAIAGRLPSGVTRVMVSEFLPPPTRTVPATFEDVCKAWSRVTGEDISAGIPFWVNAFDNASKLAAHYRAGRVLLAGDAAHLQLPSGGQAINLGLQDAVNLGWKLAAEVAGTAPAGLLDSYAAERQAVGRRVLRNIEAQSLLLLGDPDIEPARAVLAELIGHPEVRDRLAGMVSGLDVRYGADQHPLVGARLPHLDLGGRATSTELLRDGRGLLLDFSGDPLRQAALRDWADDCALRVRLVSAPQPDAVVPETVLVRPDGYVAWLGSRADDPRPALRAWFG